VEGGVAEEKSFHQGAVEVEENDAFIGRIEFDWNLVRIGLFVFAIGLWGWFLVERSRGTVVWTCASICMEGDSQVVEVGDDESVGAVRSLSEPKQSLDRQVCKDLGDEFGWELKQWAGHGCVSMDVEMAGKNKTQSWLVESEPL
jgi:hypothetical protein